MIREKFSIFSLSDSKHPERCRVSMRSLFSFISTRLIRGGPRLLIALGLFVTLMMLCPVPDRISQYSLRQHLRPLWKWSDSLSRAGSDGGGLRIVVFGTPDFATGLSPDGSSCEKTWTEQLCAELHCSSYLSYVPQTDVHSLDPALTSNEQYRSALNHILEREIDASRPAWNYTFLEQQYPVPSHPDLPEQVSSFLANGQAAEPPKETLWVFSFGTWDVWNLAAFPRGFGESAVDGMAFLLFSQVERLYRESLSESSAAYSDFWGYSEPELLEKLKVPQPNLADSRAETEVFRILIPKILDPSIVPGWNSMRPTPPSPHPKAEQVKNAAHLVERWNANMQAHMDQWKRSPNPKVEPKDQPEDDGDRAEAKRSVADSLPEEEALYAPFPMRRASLFNAPEFVLDAMVERQLRNTGLQDTNRRGNQSEASPIYFQQAQRPCSAGDAPSKEGRLIQVLTGFHSHHDGPCREPDQYLFSTPFTIAPRAIREIAGRAGTLARSELYLDDDTKAEVSAADDGKRGSESSFIKMVQSADPCPSLDIC